MTNEARVPKEMRQAKGLSMRQLGKLIGKSDSYVAHLENGRLDVPQGEKLQAILDALGGIKIKSFNERVHNYQKRLSKKDELIELVRHGNDGQVEVMLRLVKSVIA